MFFPSFFFPLDCPFLVFWVFFNVTSGTSFFFGFFTCTKGNQYGTKGDKSTYGGSAETGPAGPQYLWSHGPGWLAAHSIGRGASGDVKFDLWKDEMAGDQRAGAG